MTKSTETPTAVSIDASRRELVAKLLGVAAGGAALSALTACAGEPGDEEPASPELGEVALELTGNGTLKWADTVAALRGLTGGNANWVAVLEGYNAPQDGGGGVFYWSTTAKPDDGWSVLNSGSGNSAGWRRINPGVVSASSVTALRAIAGGSGRTVALLSGYSSAGDGGGGVFAWSATSEKDDDGTILNAGGYGATSAGWRRIHDGMINVKWFGAKGNGIDDDQTAIQRAIDAALGIALKYQYDPGDTPPAPPQWGYPTVVFPAGNYIVLQSLTVAAPTNFLRMVGLGNANLIGGTAFPGTATGLSMEKPFQASFEGLSFIGYAVGLELGYDGYNEATASVQLVRCNFYYCGVGLKYGSRSSTLSLDYCKFKANIKHIEVLRCDLIHLNRCHFNEFIPAASGDTAIDVGTGRLHVYGSSFTPGPIPAGIQETAWIGIDDRYYDPLSEGGGAHIGLIAHGVRSGDENGGLTFVNYKAAPDTTYPPNATTRILIRDSQMGPGQVNVANRDQCVVRLWQAPNHLEITGCQWSAALPVDWASGVLPDPSVHTDGPNSALVYRVEGNCDNANPARTRHWMPTALETPVRKANLLGGIRRGTDTISGTSDRVTVNLGLPSGAEIRAKDIAVTPLSSLGSASSWWVHVEPDPADEFEIRLNTQPGSPVEFAWSVDLGRY